MLDALWKTPRGIGRLLRGKFKEGFDDLGDGVNLASTIAAPFNPLLAGGMRAVGGVMDNAEEGIENMKFGRDALAPAAITAGSGYAAKGIGKLFGGAPVDPSAAVDPTVPVDRLLPLQEGAGAVEKLNPAMADLGTTVPKSGSGIGRMLSSVGNYAKENPFEVGSLALQTYGMHQQASAEDEERERAERRRRQWTEILAPAFGGQ